MVFKISMVLPATERIMACCFSKWMVIELEIADLQGFKLRNLQRSSKVMIVIAAYKLASTTLRTRGVHVTKGVRSTLVHILGKLWQKRRKLVRLYLMGRTYNFGYGKIVGYTVHILHCLLLLQAFCWRRNPLT